ncbi:CDP-glycerol glycerophosphotransferase family protein [Citrobacter sp. Marseille-Q6884]|uniref:CDP-glycerol glycerophosphotransferase family protein n=1 Tax=Citrobacter sp. Marseille-Q6884 TaxID=2956786 RepID=UPI0021B3AF4D|nr:CDP-glycerol glycerophosphotransferase family protein [Citrobacter sp. Marseille-Q6884]
MNFLIIRVIVRLLSICIPPKKGLFIYGSWFGNKYGDNSKAFFEYMSNNSDDDNYWFTKNKDVAARISAAGFKTLYGMNFRSIIVHLRAEAVFCNCSVNSDLLGQFLNRKTKVFNLWHGTPIKKIGKDAIATELNVTKLGISKQSFLISGIKKIIPHGVYSFFKLDTYYLASSATVSSILQSAMDIDKNKVIVCGYPKLDKCFQKKLEKKIDQIKILYAPTYRGDYNSELDILTLFGFNTERARKVLKENNANLTIRLHPANKLPEFLVKNINDIDCIVIDNSEDVYETLCDYSLIVTDFSSIYFDALAVGVNALIAPFGLQDYLQNDRELYFSLKDLYPGTMPYSWDDFFDNFSYYMTENMKDLSQVRTQFYDYPFTPCSRDLVHHVNSILDRDFVNEKHSEKY